MTHTLLKKAHLLGTFVFLCCLPTKVYAQLPNTPSLQTGLRLGDIVIHSNLGVYNGWTFNPGHTDAKRSVHDFLTSVSAGLNTGFSRTKYQLSAQFNAQYQQYWGVNNKATQNLSNIAFNGGYNFTLLPKTKLSFSSAANVMRSAGPANQTITRRLQHTTLTTSTGIDYRPGGKALTASLSYGFLFDYYDRVVDIPNAPQLDSFRHTPRLALSWRFLPRTTLFLENLATFSRFKETTGDNPANNNSIVYTSAVGVDSIITKKLSATARVGYSGIFLEKTATQKMAHTWATQLEGRYSFNSRQSIRGGYTHSVQATSLYQYFGTHRFYTGYGLGLTEKLQVGTQIEYQLIGYGQALRSSAQGTREDHRFIWGASLGYMVLPWLNISASESLDYRISNAVTQLGNAGYFHNTFMFGVQANY